jgi:hypothetical protein
MARRGRAVRNAMTLILSVVDPQYAIQVSDVCISEFL